MRICLERPRRQLDEPVRFIVEEQFVQPQIRSADFDTGNRPGVPDRPGGIECLQSGLRLVGVLGLEGDNHVSESGRGHMRCVVDVRCIVGDASDQIVTSVGCQAYPADVNLDGDRERAWFGRCAGRGGWFHNAHFCRVAVNAGETTFSRRNADAVFIP